jgi:Phosphatidylserine/phosphatidylglycerophosphate/cardiolipin synthases and related enzymes
MSIRNLNKEIFLNTVKNDSANGTSNAVAMLKRSFPEISEVHCEDIVESILGAMTMSDSDKVSLVVTAPPSFAINARATMNVVESMIKGADRNILITGYSLSAYFSELVDTIIQKSQQGIFVKFFVNDIDKQQGFDKLLRYKGRFLKIYNYRQEDDNMAALHAKVISIDQKQTLITSANLSYHGQQGNIELGTLIDSKSLAKQIDDIFTKMIFSKVFTEV